jgi:hypothetical protein
MLRPGGLLALHRPELLLSSFRFLGSPLESVEYNYPAKQSIAGAGLSPARHAALWAASRDRRAFSLLFSFRASGIEDQRKNEEEAESAEIFP